MCKFSECPYHGKRKEVQFSGNKQAQVLFVGEAPGHREEETGKPFVGKSGEILTALCNSISLPRESTYIANACRCRVDKAEDSASDITKALKHCRAYLVKAIEIVKPKIVVCLGAYALKQVTGKQKITENRGKMFNVDGLPCPVFATFHPAFVLRQAGPGYPNKPYESMNTVERMPFADFRLLKAIIDRGYKADKNGNAVSINTKNYVEGKLEDLKEIKKAEVVSVDYETAGGDVHDPEMRIVCVSMSIKPGHSKVFFPKNGKLPKAVLDVLSSPKIKKVVAARPFEDNVTKLKAGTELGGPKHDILVMAHLVDENSYEYNVQSVAHVYAGMANIKELAQEMRHDMGSAPKEIVIQYGGVDADAELKVFNILRDKINNDVNADGKHRLRNFYVNFMMPVQDMFAEVYHNGCLIDTKALKKAERDLSKKRDSLHEELIGMIPDVIWNAWPGERSVTRADPVRDYLFRHKKGLRLKPHKDFITAKTGEISLSGKHFKQLPANPFTPGYIERGKIAKILSTYIENLWTVIKPDGRVYPRTELYRSTTGRSVVKDPTIQTIPVRNKALAPILKRVFTADKGWLMGARDLGQSEMRIAGWIAPDRAILDALNNGVDLHVATLTDVLRVEVNDDNRQKAKAVGFGFLYGMFPQTFQIYARDEYGVNFSLAECEKIREEFFRVHRGLLGYYERTKRFVSKHGYVEDPLGRKRHLPDAQQDSDFKARGRAYLQAINFPVQAFSNHLGMLGMMLFHQETKTNPKFAGKVKAMFFIHDSILFQSKSGISSKAMQLLKECMEVRAPEYIKEKFKVSVDYPVASDGKVGENWADMKKVD